MNAAARCARCINRREADLDISKLKEALGDEKFAALQGYVDDLTGQRDAARNESITGRKGKDSKIKELNDRLQAFAERLGVEADVDLETLPDLKGAAEAGKAYDAKLKKAARERDEAITARDEAQGKFKGSLQKAAIAEALGGHEFVARDIVETYVNGKLTWEGDELLFKTDDGKLVPVKDGVAGIAKSRPELLKPTGTGGAGVRQSNAGGLGDLSNMTPVQRMDAARQVKA
ncbi:MAG: hypothetical protein ABIS29_16990 [Vicinamibacterales bacterium]